MKEASRTRLARTAPWVALPIVAAVAFIPLCVGIMAVIDSTRFLSITGNLGDVKTTIIHPATTTHGRLTQEERVSAGITDNLIRVAVGLEHVDDLRADLERGLAAVQ